MSKESKQPKVLSQQCQVCGVPAEYAYFGVVSCLPCKMFFRRNAGSRQNVLPCDFGGNCEININTRHVCPACRLKKCFDCGMDTDRFRPSVQMKPRKKTLVSLELQSPPQRFPTLNLLQADQSLLTTDQWSLITNLMHCYKEIDIQPSIQQLLVKHDTLQSLYTTYAGLVEEFLVSIYDTAGLYLRSNDDIRKLSSNDRAVMLRTAGNNVCCIGGAFIMQNYLLYDLDFFITAMNRKYGKDTMDMHIFARKFIDTDIVVVKLAISLFAFSENTCCFCSKLTEELTDPIHALEIQNKYVEITWKYLVYKYDYQDSVRRYLNLILWLMSMNTLATHAQSLVTHMNQIDAVIEKAELDLILDDVEEIITTNKQE